MQTYTVQRGDSLFKIAQKFYGDGHTYKLLALYNNIENPNALEPGQVLKIPPVENLRAPTPSLSEWHNYEDGSIYWRVTSKGVEIKGKGLIKNDRYTQRARKIWNTYQQLILKASQKHGVPVPVILATIITESNGNPKAHRYEPGYYNSSIKNKDRWKNDPYHDFPERIAASYGLMQILYTTACDEGFQGKPEDLYDPATNIDAGTAYIASPAQKRHHGWDPPKIACAYNAGSIRQSPHNGWGMHYYGAHLDRWIPSYNGAIEVIGAEQVTEPVEPEEVQPQPITPSIEVEESQSGPRSTLRFLFPKEEGIDWKPVIIDIFMHGDSGIGDPVSYMVESPTLDPNTGYIYDVSDVGTGLYDFVFTDFASSSIIYDIADYAVDNKLETIDLRPHLGIDRERAMSDITIRFRFPKKPGSVWKPLIVDVFRHEGDELGEPMSYTIKIPSHGPDGGYIYDIPNATKGVYDFVFTDATSQSVIQDISNYVVDQSIEIIDLRRNRAIYDEQKAPLDRGFQTILKNFFQKILSLLGQ